MADYCDTVEESALLGDALGMALVAPLAESAVVHGTMTVCGMVTPYVEAASIGDLVIDSVRSRISEDLIIGDVVTSVTQGRNRLVESARIGDRLPAVACDRVTESLVIGDTLGEGAVRDVVHEALLVSDALGTAATLRNRTVEQLLAGDRLTDILVDRVTEAAVLNDAIAARTRASNAIVESATLGDALGGPVAARDRVREAALIGDALSGAFTGTDTILEVGELGDGLGEVPQLSGAAWTAPTDLFAMSRYEAFPFNSMAVIDGALVGIATDGAYVLAGDTDDGAAISASVVGDLNDWVDGNDGPASSPNLRRPHHAWFGYRATGTLRVTLGHTGAGGTEVSIAHDMASTATPTMGSGRVALAHGATFRYSRLTIANVAGCDFAIQSGKVHYRMLQRRL